MAEEPDAGARKDKAGHRPRGFRRAGELIAPQTRAASARRGFALARLQALWADIVGPEIAAVTRPLRLAAARGPAGGLLTLGVDGANGPQVQMLTPLIRERANAALGPGAVGRIQLAQTGFAEAPAAFAPPPPAPPPELGPMAAPISSIGDPELRSALETLARNVLSRSRRNPTGEP